ncbi:MAG: TetR/AcrR family transcriptional regulator [Calditrichaceae bacterium]|nr:TetR/AcrR family transcriptional regulator [Calditrichaceae bacterium]
MNKKKSDPKTEKKNRIIEAAVKVFAKKGFYLAKVNDVAKAANVADGTIYLYFKNKDDLLINLFEQKMELILQRFREQLQDIADPVEKLHRFIDTYFTLIEEDKDLADVFQVELRQSDKFLKDYHNQKFLDFLSVIHSIIQEGMENGFFRTDLNADVVKILIFGTVDEIARQWILGADAKYSLEEAKENIKHILTNGLIVF